MTTLIGMVTFGNLPFTQMAIQAIRETVTEPVGMLVIVGKPDDEETPRWLKWMGIRYIRHRENLGFPASINDIYDYAWGQYGACDNVIVIGNDVIPYPGAIDALIRTARETDWEWLCSSQFDAKSLVARYPEVRPYFEGDTLRFTDFGARPWELHKDFRAPAIEPDVIKDVRNLTLFKRSVFEKIGYADVNFWPGGYFEDNDYCRRGNLAGIKACGLAHSAYFHFWSRTIHQGGKGAEHHAQFRRNAEYYRTKWGGMFEEEKYDVPFGGGPFALTADAVMGPELRIGGRDQEGRMVEFWRGI